MGEIDEKSGVVDGKETSKASSEPSEHSEFGPERDVQLHVKTFLAVFAALLIYFAQLVSLVGAGAVSLPRACLTIIPTLHSDGRYANSKAKQLLFTLARQRALFGSRELSRYSLWCSGQYSLMLPTIGAANGSLSSRHCWAESDRS